MFFNLKAKRLGDFAAGTIVVKEIPRKNLKKFLAITNQTNQQLNREPDIAKYPWIQSVLPVITQAEYFIIKNLYSRQHELSNFKELALGVIQKTIVKANLAEETTIDPEQTAEILVTMVLLYEKTYFI